MGQSCFYAEYNRTSALGNSTISDRTGQYINRRSVEVDALLIGLRDVHVKLMVLLKRWRRLAFDDVVLGNE